MAFLNTRRKWGLVTGDSVAFPGGEDLFAHLDASAYIQGSAALAQAFEDLTNDGDADWTFIQVMQSDLSLGPATTLRVFAEGIGASAGLEGWSMVRDYSGGHEDHLRVVAFGGGTTLEDLGALGDAGAGPSIVDGDTHLVLAADVGTAGAGQIKAGADGVSFVSAPGTYTRASIGAVDYFAPAGGVRGPTPTYYTPLGWTYFFALVSEDLESSNAALWSAFSSVLNSDPASNMRRACLALMAAIESEVTSTSNILYAEMYDQGSGAIYGDTATRSGVVYTVPGVSP